MIRRPPRSTLTPSFPTRRSSELDDRQIDKRRHHDHRQHRADDRSARDRAENAPEDHPRNQRIDEHADREEQVEADDPPLRRNAQATRFPTPTDRIARQALGPPLPGAHQAPLHPTPTDNHATPKDTPRTVRKTVLKG